MFMIFLYILASIMFVAYSGVGMLYSRSRYATITANSNYDHEKANQISLLKTRKDKLVKNGKIIHADFCEAQTFSGESYRREFCNCGNVKSLIKVETELNSLEIQDAPGNPSVFPPMFFWPLFVASDFIKNGQTFEQKEYTRRQWEIDEARHFEELAKVRFSEGKALEQSLSQNILDIEGLEIPAQPK